tara:strand:+ start:519 stop:1007 length:489 start_codon:yes stop_codon:yes gene_type:complete
MASKKRKKGGYFLTARQESKQKPYIVEGGVEYEIPITKKLSIKPKATQVNVGGDTVQRGRGVGVRYGDYHVKGDVTKYPYSPNRKAIEFAIDNFFGGNLRGAGSIQGESKEGKIEYTVPLGKIPMLGSLLGYKKRSKGGQIKRPKGVKIAQRGFGKAMKNGK